VGDPLMSSPLFDIVAERAVKPYRSRRRLQVGGCSRRTGCALWHGAGGRGNRPAAVPPAVDRRDNNNARHLRSSGWNGGFEANWEAATTVCLWPIALLD